MNKKTSILIGIILVLIFSTCTTGCGNKASFPDDLSADPDSASSHVPKDTDLVVFAETSLSKTLEDISGLYVEAAPNVRLLFNFDSSETLKTQIQEGAECDLFISAENRHMEQLGPLIEATHILLLENRVALVVPQGNPKDIHSFSTMAGVLSSGQLLMAMGTSSVPAGQHALWHLGKTRSDHSSKSLMLFCTFLFSPDQFEREPVFWRYPYYVLDLLF